MMANLPVLRLPGIGSPVQDAFNAFSKGPLLTLRGKGERSLEDIPDIVPAMSVLGDVELDVIPHKIQDEPAGIRQEHVLDEQDLGKLVYLGCIEVRDREPCICIVREELLYALPDQKSVVIHGLFVLHILKQDIRKRYVGTQNIIPSKNRVETMKPVKAIPSTNPMTARVILGFTTLSKRPALRMPSTCSPER